MIAPDLLAGIEELARSTVGNDFRIHDVAPVSDDNINTTLRVNGQTQSIFVKMRAAQDIGMFHAEAKSLRAMSACKELRVPAVLACGESNGQALLLLEWLALRPLKKNEEGIRAGHALASLHHIQGERYGWGEQNFIGGTLQSNTWHDNWPRFFAQQRLAPQFALAAERGYRDTLQRDGERVMERAAALFLEYRPPPSLLHGDLWHGNVGVLDTGEPALFDPACYYGDREADIAMTELFGGFPLAFYSAYRAAYPLDEGYERRKSLYNLYHVLNHLNLFGRGYFAEAKRMAARLAVELGR